jgi:hypothetical protein
VDKAESHVAERRVIEVIGVNPEAGAFVGAEVAISGGLGGPAGECSVAASWLQRSSESS